MPFDISVFLSTLHKNLFPSDSWLKKKKKQADVKCLKIGAERVKRAEYTS